MKFIEIKINNRIQIECESKNPMGRCYKGIILKVNDGSFVLVTDVGELVEIYEDKVLSVTKINFDKTVSDSLLEIRNYYNEIYDLEKKIIELKTKEKEYKENLYDANFIAKFNTLGAKNRLENSVDDALLTFTKGVLSFNVHFEANHNNQIEIIITVAEEFEHYNNAKIDIESSIRTRCPNIKDLIEKCFTSIVKVKELDKKILHDKDSLYNAITVYMANVEISQSNFIVVREDVIKGLEIMRRI